MIDARKPKYKMGVFIPNTYAEAMRQPEAQKWKEADDRELDAMDQFQVFEKGIPFDSLSKEEKKNVMFLKRIYDLKPDLRFKMRLVARGDRQRPGTYGETYAPVVRMEAVRIFASVCVQLGNDVDQVDVSNAYLMSLMDVLCCYAWPPKGRGKVGEVWGIRRALYGLKQSGRCWFKEISKTLREYGFDNDLVEPCLWRKK